VDIEDLRDIHGLEEGSIVQSFLGLHDAWQVEQGCQEQLLVDEHPRLALEIFVELTHRVCVLGVSERFRDSFEHSPLASPG
jgi:hypothetical protein